MDNQKKDYSELKETAQSWLWCVGILIVCGIVLRLLTNPDVYKIEKLADQIPQQALKVYDALEKKGLVPLETLVAVATLQPEWEEKKMAKNAAWDRIGPGGKIKDAGSTTSKGRDWYKKLDIFKAIDRKMTAIKHSCVRSHGSKLVGTDAARHWSTYEYLKKDKKNRIDRRRWYEKGGWGAAHILVQMVLRITCLITFFGSVCLTFLLFIAFLGAVQ